MEPNPSNLPVKVESPSPDIDELINLLRDLRTYTGQLEAALQPFVLTRANVVLPDGWHKLRPRLDAVLGPPEERVIV